MGSEQFCSLFAWSNESHFVVALQWPNRVIRARCLCPLTLHNTSGPGRRTATAAADNEFDVVRGHIRGCWRHRLDSRSTSVYWTSVQDAHSWRTRVTTAVQLTVSSMDTSWTRPTRTTSPSVLPTTSTDTNISTSPPEISSRSFSVHIKQSMKMIIRIRTSCWPLEVNSGRNNWR